jgi:hypothetical protein
LQEEKRRKKGSISDQLGDLSWTRTSTFFSVRRHQSRQRQIHPEPMVLISDFEKLYIDQGVQTESLRVSSPCPNASTSLARRSRRRTSDPINDKDAVHKCTNDILDPACRDLKRPDLAYNHHFEAETNPNGLRQVSRRKHARINHDRSSRTRQGTSRVVSLPETTPLHSIKSMLESTTQRIASMSERPKPDMSPQDAASLDGFEASASTETSYLTADEGPYLPRHAGFLSLDVPHTPSPPSSPESVMIIENSIHLPQSFLRHNSSLKSHPHSTFHDRDEGEFGECLPTRNLIFPPNKGWITWASSPPRPIPALHGPLSLPYARCPS